MGAFRSTRELVAALSFAVGNRPCEASDLRDLTLLLRQVLDDRYGGGNVYSSHLDEMVGAAIEHRPHRHVDGHVVARMAALLELAKEQETHPEGLKKRRLTGGKFHRKNSAPS